MLVKDMSTRKFIPRIFSNMHESIAFDNFKNIYLSLKNDLGRFSIIAKFNLLHENISTMSPTPLIQEKNPNF